MDKFLKKQTLFIFIVYFLINLFIFATLSFLNWTLITGFILGTLFSMISFFINLITTKRLLSRRRRFTNAFLISMIKFLLWTIITCFIFIGIIFLNKQFDHSAINGIFNIFTFIYGCITVPIIIILDNFWNIFKSKKLKIN